MQNEIKTLYSIDAEKYFNSGVLLINTEKWMENDLTNKCIKKVNDGNIYRFADQDVLNILLENKTILLPIKYNTKIHITIPCSEEKKIAKYTVLLHYVTGYKPWYQTFDSQLFKKYYQLSPWKNLERPLALKKSWLRNYAKLLHYVTGYKPWYQTFNSQLFKKYYQLSPWKDVERPLALKKSWLRNYAKYCFKQKKFISAMQFYYFYLLRKIN